MSPAHTLPMVKPKKTRKRAQLFTPVQLKILIDTVRRAERRFKSEGLTQEELAKALDLTQPSVSRLKNGAWRPGLTTARYIAQLEGKTLEDLVGPVRLDVDAIETAQTTMLTGRFQNLEAAIRYHQDESRWSPWTLASARAGFFGDKDFAPADWTEKLDELEKGLNTVKR